MEFGKFAIKIIYVIGANSCVPRQQVHSGQSNDVDVLLCDASRAVLEFFTPLNECAAQIFFSVLLLLPKETLLRKLYWHEYTGSVSIVGIEDKWSPCLRVINISSELGVEMVSVSFDSMRIASVLTDGVVRLWDTNNGELKVTLQSSDGFSSVGWLSDGRVITGSRSVTIWDALTGSPEQTLPDCSGPVAVSPDGATVLVRHPISNTIIVLDTSSWTEKLRFLPRFEKPHYREAACLSDALILCAGTQVIDMTGGERFMVQGSTSNSFCMAISPDGYWIAQCGGLVWSGFMNLVTGTNRLFTTRSGTSTDVFSLAFSPDGKHIAGGDDAIYIWDLETGVEICRLIGHTGRVVAVIFSRDGRLVISGSKDGTIRIWDWMLGCDERVTRDNPYISSLAFSPDGTSVISGSRNATILWEARSGRSEQMKLLNARISDSSGFKGVTFSPDGCQIASFSGGCVNIWDARTQTHIEAFSDVCNGYSPGVPGAIAMSPNGYLIALRNSDIFGLWNLQTKNRVVLPSNYDGADYFVFSRDSCYLASAIKRRIKIYTTQGTPVPLFTFETKHRSHWLSFSNDGTRIMNETETFDIPSTSDIASTTTLQRLGEPGSNILHVRDGWVIDTNGKRQCWVPEIIRGNDVYASHGNRLALGSPRGHVTFLEFPE